MIADKDIARLAKAMRANGVAVLKTTDVEIALMPGWVEPHRSAPPKSESDEQRKARLKREQDEDDAITFASTEGFPP